MTPKERNDAYEQGRRDERARCIRICRRLVRERSTSVKDLWTDFRQGQEDGAQMAVDALARSKDA